MKCLSRIAVVTGLLLSMTLVHTARAQVGADDGLVQTIQSFLQKIAELENRIKELEERIKLLERGGGDGGATNDLPQREQRFEHVLRIESFEILPADESLIKEADAKEVRAQELDDNAAEARKNERKYGELYNRWLLNEDDEREKELEYRRLRDKYRTDATLFESDARNLRTHAKRLRKDAASPRHVVTGWNGRRTVSLRTTRDLSHQFKKITVGDYIDWRGARTDAGTDFEIWDVTWLEEVDQPKGFVERPNES